MINKEIFDPTLSFQLGQGFSVLDVAKNYLLNDPESLGYAAVIEWLNEDVASDKDFKRQKQSIEYFMSNQNIMIEHLPMELRRVVRKMTRLLGEVIREYEGDKFFERIEQYRRRLKRSRHAHDTSNLAAISKKLNAESKEQQLKVAHAFSLLLEVMNLCESAHRTWRQRQKPVHEPLTKKIELNFVLTAHPTEARDQTVVEILGSLTGLLVEGLNNNFVFNEPELSSQFRMLWLHPLVKTEAPTVNDEANYMYSLVFGKSQVDFLLKTKTSYDLKLRTWVGGDKDGHP
ncbi:MAG: phosphoenolpyruvate carboxylase, partial [Bdellovibrionaceae bacterium]|nr:phosphoenolpyruvate carboxylase [Pseudobdellovibrionaceae bacterium]